MSRLLIVVRTHLPHGETAGRNPHHRQRHSALKLESSEQPGTMRERCGLNPCPAFWGTCPVDGQTRDPFVENLTIQEPLLQTTCDALA